MSSKWSDDNIQFPRLIAELLATQDIDKQSLASSMDLSLEELQELFDRAESVWSKHKWMKTPDYDINDFSSSVTEAERIKYLENMENIIKREGCFIQGVNNHDEEPSYAYTIGRSDQGKPDLYMSVNAWSEASVINKIVQALDNGEIKINEPTTLPDWVCAYNGKPTKFVVTDRQGYHSKQEVLGVYSRDQRMGRETIPLLTIILGNAVNELPYPWNTTE